MEVAALQIVCLEKPVRVDRVVLLHELCGQGRRGGEIGFMGGAYGELEKHAIVLAQRLALCLLAISRYVVAMTLALELLVIGILFAVVAIPLALLGRHLSRSNDDK